MKVLCTNFLSLLPIICSTFFMVSCGGKNNTGVTVNPTIRNGQSIQVVEPKYMDVYPSLSSDANKLVFVSGKDDTVTRTRTATRSSSTDAFSTPAKLSTGTLFTTESQAVVSANGNNIAVLGYSSSGAATLALCDWAGSSCTKLTESSGGVGSFGFSPESSALYYLEETISSYATLKIIDVSSPGTSFQVGSSNHWDNAVWVPVASGFSIAAREASTTVSGTFNIKLFTFASAAGAPSATETALATSVAAESVVNSKILGGSAGVTAATKFLIAHTVKPNTSNAVTEFGNYTPASDQKKLPVSNQMYSYNTSGGTDVTAITATSIKTLELHLASDQDSIFSLSQIAGRCAGETDFTYGTVFQVTNRTSGSATWNYLKKPADLSQAPTSTTDFCDRKIGDTATSLDLNISGLTVNDAASATAYTAAWTSMMTGDPEIIVMDVSASGSTLRNASGNRKP